MSSISQERRIIELELVRFHDETATNWRNFFSHAHPVRFLPFLQRHFPLPSVSSSVPLLSPQSKLGKGSIGPGMKEMAGKVSKRVASTDDCMRRYQFFASSGAISVNEQFRFCTVTPLSRLSSAVSPPPVVNHATSALDAGDGERGRCEADPAIASNWSDDWPTHGQTEPADGSGQQAADWKGA